MPLICYHIPILASPQLPRQTQHVTWLEAVILSRVIEYKYAYERNAKRAEVMKGLSDRGIQYADQRSSAVVWQVQLWLKGLGRSSVSSTRHHQNLS
jgi:hypothetical protein